MDHVLELAAVRVSFEVTGQRAKKAGTTVDITFRQRQDGNILAYVLNAGRLKTWEPAERVAFELFVKQRELRFDELRDCCVRLSWFPEHDEDVRFTLRLLVTFADGTEVERAFPDRRVGHEDDSKEHTLGLFPW